MSGPFAPDFLSSEDPPIFSATVDRNGDYLAGIVAAMCSKHNVLGCEECGVPVVRGELTTLDHEGLTVGSVRRAADVVLADELATNDAAAAAVLSALRKFGMVDSAAWLSEAINRARATARDYGDNE